MTVLKDYRQFDGRHWETGSVCNYFACRGVKAPHTGKPFSEAFFMGISGGAVMGYFPFAYEGIDPMARVLTRNTFDPFDTMLERLGVIQNIAQTTNPDKARKNLINALDDGTPAIVWADVYSMPYVVKAEDFDMWLMWPIVCYGYDESAQTAHIADRSKVGLTANTAELDAARARIKKDKFKLLTPDPPREDKLASAVSKGIWDCIKLYLETPPKGAKDNFGLAALQRWSNLLSKPDQRNGWGREFPPGGKMYAGLTSAFTDIAVFGKETPQADRDLYADFLDEASILLDKKALKQAAEKFRACGKAWEEMGRRLLPDEVAPFKETRELMLRKNKLFLDQGNATYDERQKIEARLKAIRKSMDADFPLDEAGVTAMRESMAAHLLALHDLEKDAVFSLQSVMS
jgi:hypothetical protein